MARISLIRNFKIIVHSWGKQAVWVNGSYSPKNSNNEYSKIVEDVILYFVQKQLQNRNLSI